jgi:hypothetical protein
MVNKPWSRDRYPPIYTGERKLTRVGNTYGVLLPKWWAEDNTINIGDKVMVRVESMAHRKKVLRAKARPKPVSEPIPEPAPTAQAPTAPIVIPYYPTQWKRWY